jgi:hypothetical protein
MFRKLSYLLILILLGCEEDNPKPVKKYADLDIISGNKQSGKTSEALASEIVLRVTPINNQYKRENFYIEQRSQEDGLITASSSSITGLISADQTGVIKAIWKLGCLKKDQAITLYLYYSDSCTWLTLKPCVPIDSVQVTATASTPQGWNKACGIYEVDQFNTRIRTYNNTQYAVNSGKLYRAEMDEGMFWREVPGVPVDDIFDFGFTSTGKVYALTETHGVYKSDDLQTWTSTSNGILDPRYPISLLVEDTTVYVSFLFDGLYRMRPAQSNFWKKLLINGKYYEEYEWVTRHPNGNLYLVDKWDDYWVSSNSGNSWTHIPIQYKYVNYQTEDLKIHSSGQIYIGSGDASLAILNPETYTGTLHTYYQWNASHQLINNIIFRNTNDVYYLVNYTPDPGIYSSVNNWQKIDIDFGDKPIKLFVFEPNGKFLLGTYDGIYYWKD